MESDSSSGWQGKGALEELMRERIRTTIEGIIDEELVAALGAVRSQRSGPVRVGYRHGSARERLTTSLGTRPPSQCRGHALRVKMVGAASGAVQSFRAISVAPKRVDEAILGVYQRHQHAFDCAAALAPLLRGAPFVKGCSIASVGRLREDFAAWAQRDRGELKIRYLFLDGWYPRIRIGKSACAYRCWSRWGFAPMAAGWCSHLRLAGVEERGTAWLDAVRSWARALGAPLWRSSMAIRRTGRGVLQ